MLKICVVSDNHGDEDCLQKVLSDNPACDYYFHLGDSMRDPKEIEPFISVKGNNDWYYDYPKKRIIELEGHRILMIHGDGYTYSMNAFCFLAQQENCDMVLFGHTHMFFDEMYNGIHFINPGSIWRNRDLTPPCYARLYLDKEKVRVERIDL